MGVAGDIYLGGSLYTTATGAPEISSASDLSLTALNRVLVTQTPFRVASFTNTNRDLISAVNGDIIYNTSVNRFQGYQNGGWINLDDGTPV
jgi:hypothetical protein